VKIRDVFWRLVGRSVEDWDAHYESGDDVKRIDAAEEPRYAAISELTAKVAAVPSVLDLGCGSGLLYASLRDRQIHDYTGVDLSASAITLARRFADDRTKFVAADIRVWNPPNGYDAIVFNEVLYYLEDPLHVVKRYLPALRPGGALLVSMYHPRSVRQFALRFRVRFIERSLRRQFRVVEEKWIPSEPPGLAWRLSMLRPHQDGG
jgi:SAM-dependent methyltransferase